MNQIYVVRIAFREAGQAESITVLASSKREALKKTKAILPRLFDFEVIRPEKGRKKS